LICNPKTNDIVDTFFAENGLEDEADQQLYRQMSSVYISVSSDFLLFDETHRQEVLASSIADFALKNL
jgi:hypothetical protein